MEQEAPRKISLKIISLVLGGVALLGLVGSNLGNVTTTNVAGEKIEIAPSTTPTPTPTPTPTFTPIPTPTPILTPEPANTQAQQTTPYAPCGTYINTAGNEVPSPCNYNSAPSGATAICADGTYSFSQSRRGTCSHHGGVSQWL